MKEKRQNGKSRLAYFKKNLPLSMMAMPFFIILLVFNYLPLYGLILPFKDFRYDLGFFKSPWVGFDNFKFLFSGEDVLHATRNTILYNAAFIVLGTVISLALAIMLFEFSKKFVKTYQTLLFLPYFISWVVAAYVFRAFLDMDYGIINKVRESMGLTRILWYNDPKYWPAILVIANTWKNMGYYAVVYYAAMMGVDKTYYEAARIDGAGKWVQMRHITLPLIRQMVIIMLIMQIGKIFYGDFGLFYNVPLDSSLLYSATDVIDTFVYRALISLGDVGMSSAAGFYQSVIGFILVLLTNAVVRKVDSESALF